MTTQYSSRVLAKEESMRNYEGKKECTGCGLCGRVCPFHVIDIQIGKPAALHPDRQHLCIRCGQCMAVCPSRFIQIEGLSYDENFPEYQPHGIKEENFASFLASRRSLRDFEDREVPGEAIRTILNSVGYAPFGCHR